MNSYKFPLFVIFASFLLGDVVNQRLYNCSSTAACGCSARPAVLSRIVGGEDASNLTWNWIVSLRSVQTNSHFCGGSIIAPSYVLTAAHCTVPITSTSLIRVHVGSIYSSAPAQVRNVTKIINHPSYSDTTLVNDISIIQLSSPLDLDLNNLDKICLPTVTSSVLSTGEYPIPGTNVSKTIRRKIFLMIRIFSFSLLQSVGAYSQKTVHQILRYFNKLLFKSWLPTVPFVEMHL